MSLHVIVFSVIFASVAVSYGWGMRGYIIGGEKGAMLPGALLGMSVALFCGNGRLINFLPFFCAVGALSMFYGGTEPYAQTMHYILRRDDKNSFAYNNVKKGIIGISLKGGLWFSVCAAMLAMLPGALSGKYTTLDIIILFASIPFISFIGRKVFNSPFDADKRIFPKIYFSDGSREEWGANILIVAEIIVLSIIRKDGFVWQSSVVGFIFGGIGFTSGLLMYDFTVRKHKGHYFFGKFQELGMIDGWKIMEHAFGSIGGGGVMLWFCIKSEHVTELLSESTYNAIIEKSNSGEAKIFPFVIILLLLLTFIQYPIRSYYEKKSGVEPDIHIFEMCERPCFSAFPLIFIFIGYEKCAWAVSVLTVMYVLCEKCAVEWFSEFKKHKYISAVFVLYFATAVALFFSGIKFTPVILVTLYTFGYTVCILYKSYNAESRRKRAETKKSVREFYAGRLTVDGHLFSQCIVIVMLTALYTL